MAGSATNEDDFEAWCKAEGVPRTDEPFIQKFLDGRDALVAREKQQRSDHAFRQTLSPMAAEAAAIVSAIRFEEQQTLWKARFEDDLAEAKQIDVYPGMMFSLARERMEKSKLWKIVRRMPKGALLHCHLEAMGDLDWLVEQAFTTPGMCISGNDLLDSHETRLTGRFLFRYAEESMFAPASSIWSSEYVIGSPVPVTQAADSFPAGGKDGFISWLRSRVTITPDESIAHHTGPNAIWTKFVSCFAIIASLQHYEPIWRGFVRNMLRQLLEDGVQWVDLRTNPSIPYYQQNCASPDSGFENMLDAMEEEIESFKATEEGKRFWGARVIWTSIRHFDTKGIIEDMKRCIDLKLQFPDLIAGYDLVGQEDLGRPLADLVPELFWFKKKCAEAGVDIPFFFHAGETLGDGDSVDENLFDAVLLGTRRIGHGFSLYKHPLLCEMVKDRKILIESCPVSNEVLRLTGSILSHPLPALLARGIPCCLSNDDPIILGQGANGMTHDFWQALQGWENLGLEGLASLAENSVRWAIFDDCSTKEWNAQIKDGAYGSGIRAQRMKEWATDFEKFCQWVVLEYGADVDLDGDDAVDT